MERIGFAFIGPDYHSDGSCDLPPQDSRLVITTELIRGGSLPRKCRCIGSMVLHHVAGDLDDVISDMGG